MAKKGTAEEIRTISDFSKGYRNREDTSLLDPLTLVAGSHDVLTATSNRVGSRKGYTIDGEESMVQAGIESSFDWTNQYGDYFNLRSGFLTSVGNDGKLQIRYEDADGAVTWLDLLTSLTSVSFNYVPFWDSAAVRSYLLFVNGSDGIYRWNGAFTTLASATGSTVTTNDTRTFAQMGFSATGSFIAAGVTYAYTGGTSTTTLTGVTPDPSAIPADTPIYQTAVFTAVGSMTFTTTPAPPTGFTFDLISQVNNQVFFASLTSNLLYMSKAGTYIDYSQSTARLQNEGEQFTTQGTLKALIPEENQLYVGAGLDEWYYADFTQTTITNQVSGTTLVYENAELQRVKTTSGQAPISQALTSRIKNDIVYVSNESILNTLGIIPNFLSEPQVVDISFPIVNDMDAYDFTGGSVFYSRQFVYMSVPTAGLFRMYNMTNPSDPYWEAPINISISCFSQLPNGQILGHSSITSESYVLFNGYSDRAVDLNSTGTPISSQAVFAFQTQGLRPKRKSFNKFFVEGYMSRNTQLNVGLTFRSPNAGQEPAQTLLVDGSASYVLGQGNDNSLGKFSLGKEPLGGDSQLLQQNALPYYFAVILTTLRYPYLNYQPSFYSYGVNQPWELLSFGTNATPTTETEADITV